MATPQPSPWSSLSDDEVMSRVGEGQGQALGELVTRYHRRAWAVAARYAGGGVRAEDLVQETFLRILESAPRYRPQGRFPAYMVRTLVHVALNQKRRRWLVFGEPVEEPSAPDPGHERVDLADGDRALALAMAALPPRQRMALALRYAEDASYQDMAEALGVSVKAVERLVAHARETLRKLMGA
jgi:RNA polymerase sigma-70 factor (ECF subfamily)